MSGAPVNGTFRELLAEVDRLLSVPRQEGSGDDAQYEDDPKYLDVVANLLAYLARRMTELHEARMAEEASFLEWLEEQLGCAVDDLSGKTFVRDYHNQPEGVDKLLEVIEKNHPGTTDLDVSKPEGYKQENAARRRIVEGYERSMETLQPILTQLELTDDLIDQVVYRLYGLSEEQVQVVEETLAGR